MTGRPELAMAPGSKSGSPTLTPVGAGKLIVWPALGGTTGFRETDDFHRGRAIGRGAVAELAKRHVALQFRATREQPNQTRPSGFSRRLQQMGLPNPSRPADQQHLPSTRLSTAHRRPQHIHAIRLPPYRPPVVASRPPQPAPILIRNARFSLAIAADFYFGERTRKWTASASASSPERPAQRSTSESTRTS